ncbi:methylated-DNA--[protein]-cysteine S-methyltransferase [Amycolatopsis nigrescens]|uniref:methylated-DNA--[protein]-cysteine S-methyltransferase n=1 Tax=Amycolatopsis nigrescens TaxID=381445 RepID=UPI00036CA58A|nr:methylated-DNA--[protein]-cysteine S-methyltransferase [Amycolatopsis nigrescens]
MTTPDPLFDQLSELSSAAPPRSLLGLVFGQWTLVDGPAGELYVAFTDQGISYLRTADSVPDEAGFAEAYRERFGKPLRHADRPPAGLLRAIRDGNARSLRFDLRGLSEFERDVLAATRRIPTGQTRPYGWIAREIGRPGAVRAVGSALGRNPVPVLIPCHRVTRSDGTLGEYVFGAATKERLLRAEHTNLDEVHALAGKKVHYLGSATTGIVCFPTCHNARRISEPHRRGFGSVKAAERAGYRPCRACRPGVPA